MFTGIIQAVGTIAAIQPNGQDWVLSIAVGSLDMADVNLGDSIAVNGICLTVIQRDPHQFMADVSAETLQVTALKQCAVGHDVNLEKALRLSDRLGGHLVSGHVDGVGTVQRMEADGRSTRFTISLPEAIRHYVAPKGSITINGVSLTVNRVWSEGAFDVNIVPHTLAETTLSSWQVGSWVNLEVDVIARYLERLLSGQQEQITEPQSNVTLDYLKQHGFA